MNNLFEISSDEKNRIMNLHESATKRQYLTLEQSTPIVPTTTSTVFPKQNVGNQFKYGQYESDVVKNSIINLKPKIDEFIKTNGGKQFVVNISAGESNVTNPKGFETKGSLALARANSVKKYFGEIFPDLIKSGVLVIKTPKDVSQVILGKTPYDRTKGDSKNPEKIKQYNLEQFVTFDIQGAGQLSNTTNICNWKVKVSGGAGELSKNYVTTNVKLYGTGTLNFSTGRIPDRLVIMDSSGVITQDTGYVATGPLTTPYKDFKYVPIYVAQLSSVKLKGNESVSGSKIITITANNYDELLQNILVDSKNYKKDFSYGGDEVFLGLQQLKKLCNSGVKEFVIYTIITTEFTPTPFNTKTGDEKVLVYSPVGSTGYSVNGSC